MIASAAFSEAPPRPSPGGPGASTERAKAFVDARLARATSLGRTLGDDVQDPEAIAAGLRRAFQELADPEYHEGQHFVAPGLGSTFGVRSPLIGAVAKGFVQATRRDSTSTLLLVADRLLRVEELEVRWFAFGILDRTLGKEAERTWQLLRRAGREAADWITVDALAHPVSRGILAEAYRWAELEQLTYSPNRWERRLVGSTIATLPFADRRRGRDPEVAARALPILGQLIGDAEPDVQKALSWAYRSMTVVDLAATSSALEDEAERAATAPDGGDGHRAWVIRDALPKLEAATAARLRARLDGIRRRPGAPSTSTAAAAAAQFAAMGLGAPLPEPPLA